MNQVKKDILNGWKEIGGYLGRDKRTVERWEKQRGLPVRRVPGAGRATVYALIAELDEWLEKSPPDATETVFEDLPAENQPMEADSLAVSVLDSPTDVGRAGVWLTPRRRWQIAGVVAVSAAVLVVVSLLPMVRSHAHSPVEARNAVPTSAVAYRSKVDGVDDLYLRGIYSSEQRTPESLKRSEEDFSAAIAKDPSYAPAYAALANTYNLLREYSVMPEAEAYPKARVAAERAIALDPKLPDAHAALGFIDFFWLWDSRDADHEFLTAISLDPASALAHHWYGSMLTHEGRFDEALEQLNTAQRLEPTSTAIVSMRALALGLNGHRDEAIDLLRDLVNENPESSSPHAILATLSRVEPQDPALYLEEMRRTAELRKGDELVQVAVAAQPALRSGGESAMWSSILATEVRLHPGAADRTYLMADAETALGRTDAAFADLNLLARRRDPQMMGVLIDPTVAPLRHDPRFAQLVVSMGLPSHLR